jgi:hypothetical protein
VLLLIAVVVWSIGSKPIELENFDLDTVTKAAPSDEGEQTSENDHQPLNASDFDVSLWHTPEAESPVAEKQAPQPARINLQLMAISQAAENQQYVSRTAVVYDPVIDQIHSVQEGAMIGSFRVQSISETSVELTDGRRVALLKLEMLEPQP